MFEALENIDRQLFLRMNDVHSPWLDTIMWYASWTATWIPLFLFFCWFALKKKGWKFLLMLLLTVGISVAITDIISFYGIKETVQRYRPTHNHEIGHLVKTVLKPDGTEYRGGMHGFVSSHAANFAAVTIILLLNFRAYSRWWYLLILWFALIAYSRIYLGVHYPSDILAGTLLGLIVGYIGYRILRRFSA